MKLPRILSRLAASAFALSSVCFIPLNAHAADENAVCSAYGKIGGYLVGSLLPRSLQDFVDMNTGKNPEFAKELITGLLSELNGVELMAFSTLGEEDASLLGESAGQVSVALLMEGTNKDDVINTMRDRCLAVGSKQITANMKASKIALDKNIK